MNRKLKMGMVGGGPGAFIGEVHRKAARLDGGIELVAGAFGIDPEKSRQTGRELGFDPQRIYADFQTMLKEESARPAGERIDFVSICTPNHTHFPIAKAFLEAGFHVMCEKPMTLTVKEALELKAIQQKSGKIFGIMHPYTAYPMVKLAREMIRQGDLGKIRKVIVQYAQGWLARPIEKEGQQQASWRTDPKKSGAAGCMGDIGTHAAHLAEYVSGLTIQEIAADLTAFVEGRRLDDDGSCLLRFNQGAKGLLHASQVAIGQENNLALWVHGEDASLQWRQEHPNELVVDTLDAPTQIWKRGNPSVAAKSAAAARATRLPPGHPEAFLEAFANNYCNFSDTIRAHARGESPPTLAADFPGIQDGVAGMQFIEAAVASSQNNAAWTAYGQA